MMSAGTWLPSSITTSGAPSSSMIRRSTASSVWDPITVRIRPASTNDLSSMSSPMICAFGKNHFHIRSE